MASILAFDKLGRYRWLRVQAPSALDEAPMRRMAAAVRRARAQAALSREALARLAGVDVEAIVALENGYGSPHAGRQLLRRIRRACSGRGNSP